MKKHPLNRFLLATPSIAFSVAALMNVNSAMATLHDMTWTAGGNLPGYEGALVPDMGTIDSSGTTATSMSAIYTTKASNGEMGAVWFDGSPTGGPIASQTLRLAYGITINTQPTDATVQPKSLDLALLGGSSSAGNVGILFGMNIAATVPNGPWAFRFAAAPTGANSGVFAMRTPDNLSLIAFAAYTVGTTYQVILDANYTTGRLDAYVDGNLVLSQYQFRSGAPNVTTSEVFTYVNGQSGLADSVTINDLTVMAPVPEPSTCLAGLLLVLPLGFQICRRLRNR